MVTEMLMSSVVIEMVTVVSRNLRVAAHSATEVEVMWDRPEPELSHGTVIRYNIGYREFGWVHSRVVHQKNRK